MWLCHIGKVWRMLLKCCSLYFHKNEPPESLCAPSSLHKGFLGCSCPCISYLPVPALGLLVRWSCCRTFLLPYLQTVISWWWLSSTFWIPVFLILTLARCVYKYKNFKTWVTQSEHFWKSNSCVSWLNELWTLLKTWVITLVGKRWVPLRTWRMIGIEENKQFLYGQMSIGCF